MRDKPSWQFGFGVFLGGMLVAVSVIIASYYDHEDWRHQTVKHGCAEYYLDENDDRQWRWK